MIKIDNNLKSAHFKQLSLRLRVILVIMITVFPLTACGSQQLSADSKCSDYIKADGQTRYDAAIRISSILQLEDPGNPMWELDFDSVCGAQLNLTIRQAFHK